MISRQVKHDREEGKEEERERQRAIERFGERARATQR